MLTSLETQPAPISKQLRHQIWDNVEIARDQQVEWDAIIQAGKALLDKIRPTGSPLAHMLHATLEEEHANPF